MKKKKIKNCKGKAYRKKIKAHTIKDNWSTEENTASESIQTHTKC